MLVALLTLGCSKVVRREFRNTRLVWTHLSASRARFWSWLGHFHEARRVGYRRYTETSFRFVQKEGKTVFASVDAVEDPYSTRHVRASAQLYVPNKQV